MEFCTFDEAYLDALCAGDFRTQDHFTRYFSELIKVKLRSRVRSAEAMEDIRQETFARVFATLRSDRGIRQPEKLGAFVNSTCNNVLLEYYRSSSRTNSTEDESAYAESVDTRVDAFGAVVTREVQEKVRRVLEDLPERDRRLIREVLLEERSKDEVCKDFGVDRDYLRVLLHRAKQSFKIKYIQQTAVPARPPVSPMGKR